MTGLKSTSFGIGEILTFSLKRYRLDRVQRYKAGQSVEKPEDSETYQKAVSIYRTADSHFLAYVTFN